MSPAVALIRTLRPRQWVKNLFVAAPLVFAKQLTDEVMLARGALALAAFCALSGAVYLLNDVVDVEKDRAHPQKRHRPIAAGQLGEREALVAAVVLAGGALGAAGWLALPFLAVSGAYLLLNLLYSFRLKHVAYVDVLVIAAGFLLRVLGGAYALPVPASPWLLVCTVLLAAFLGFGKRAHELEQATAAGAEVGRARAALRAYHPERLRALLLVLGVATAGAYVAYTQAPHTIEFFGTRNMALTAPFCLFGLLRFYRLTTRPGAADSPTEAMLRDWPFMLNLALWGLAVLAIIYMGTVFRS